MIRAMQPLDCILAFVFVLGLLAMEFVVVGRMFGFTGRLFVGSQVVLAGCCGWVLLMALSMAFSR